jgi:hypothetical protein
VLVDRLGIADTASPPPPVEGTTLTDDGRRATIQCIGPKSAGLGEQRVELVRPSRLTIDRKCSQPLTWWCAGDPRQEGPAAIWSDGTRLTVTHGKLTTINPKGYLETKVHFGGMKFADPHPFTYPSFTVEPAGGRIVIEVATPENRKADD